MGGEKISLPSLALRLLAVVDVTAAPFADDSDDLMEGVDGEGGGGSTSSTKCADGRMVDIWGSNLPLRGAKKASSKPLSFCTGH